MEPKVFACRSCLGWASDSAYSGHSLTWRVPKLSLGSGAVELKSLERSQMLTHSIHEWQLRGKGKVMCLALPPDKSGF